MPVTLGLWTLTLLPGEKVPVYVRRDFQITNASLGEDLKAPEGRSVVKVSHTPIPEDFFDSDSDSEIDSDIEIDDDEVDEDEDEFELDVEEGFKLTPKKGGKAVNGKTEDDDEDEDEEEDDEEEDEDDDSDFSAGEFDETSVITALTAGKIEQTQINLTFIKGDVVIFETSGENAVHLMGNYIYQPEADNDSEYDSEYDSEDFDDEHDDYSDLELDDEEDVPAGKITEISDAPVKSKKEAAAPAAENKKRKADAIESPAPKPTAAETEALSKNQKKKLAKKAKTDGAAPAPAAAAAPAAAQPKKEKKAGEKQKRTLPSGLVIEDVKTGDGPIARTGKRLGMRYIGKLESNDKQFDANTGGKPFTFVLGKGEVIRGWDEGLAGMAVGGERRLTIPAALAYGSQKLPGIPKNSTLKFDVKLVSVN